VIYYTIVIENSDEQYRCSSNESLLNGMERLAKKGIPVGCRGGGCGICLVQIIEGNFKKCAMSREFISEEDEAKGRVLACRIKPASHIRLTVIGGMRKNICRSHSVIQNR